MKRFLALLMVMAMMAGQLTGLSAVAEKTSTDENPHVLFEAEDDLSEEEYNQKKSEFMDEMLSGLAAVPATMAVRSTSSGNMFSNEYLEFAVNQSTGRFTIGTVAGNPELSTDDNKVMLYGHSNPWSSYTTVRVNGTSYIYGSSGFTVSPYFNDGANSSEAVFGDISVKQIISIVENASTQREDVVEIKYVVSNRGSRTASLGLRVMLDTMLGSNDAAPFRIPGYGNLTSEKEFVGDEIPQYWQAFDSLENPSVVSYGNFISGAIKPDKVQFTNWQRVYNTSWNYQVREGINTGDSAVSMIWERTLAAGAQETYVVRYGLSELLQDLQPPLGVTVAAGSTIQANAAKDGYLSYPITIYVKNVSGVTANNVACTIQLPDELVFADTNENQTVQWIGTMSAGEEITIDKLCYVKALHSQEVNTQFHVSVSAVNTETKKLTKQLTISAITVTEKTGQFKYAGYINQKKDSTATYVYSDRYFDDSAQTYNKQLATMSLCLELSAWSSWEGDPDNWSERSRNAYALLNDIGFTYIKQNDAWNQKPSKNSIGAVVAYKNIGDATVVAVAIRGGGYYDEWGGNFVLGKSGNHEGFETAKNKVYRFLELYIHQHKSKFKGELKIWIVGYSRGGAVANLLAGQLTEDRSCDGLSLPTKNIYAYTFEAPQGYVNANGTVTSYGHMYNNIHNIVNSMDVVPLVAPSVMGFQRYNRNSVAVFPTLATKAYENKVEAIQEQYAKVRAGIPSSGIEMSSTEIKFDPSPYAMKIDLGIDVDMSVSWKKWRFLCFSGSYITGVQIDANAHWKSRDQELTVDTMLKNNLNSVFSGISGGRVGYVNNIENPLSSLIAFFMGYENTIDWSEALYEAFFSNDEKGAREIAGVLINPFLSRKQKIQEASELAAQLIIDAALKQTGTNLNEVKTAFISLLKAVMGTFIDDPQQFFGFLYYLVGDNGLQHHWPEVTLAAVMADDTNYTNTVTSVVDDPQSYRVVLINCPVDAVVYDGNRKILSTIAGETVTNNSLVHGASITEDGTKQVVLPADAAYTIEINATDHGEMSVSVLEYNTVLQQYTLLYGWQNVSIHTGEQFIADIPAYASKDYRDLEGKGSTTNYQLTGPKGVTIEPTLQLLGEQIEYHQVTLSSNNQKGIVTGGGQFVTSSFAQVQAIPMPTVEFLGWYLNGTCVSTEETYRFAVNDDVNLVAHFSEGDFHKLTVKATAGGTVNLDEIELPESVEIQLVAEPESGYVFDRWEASNGDLQDEKSATTMFTMPDTDATVTAVFKDSNVLTIVKQPVDQYVVVGQRATFSLEATGKNVTYQWYINRNNGNGWKKIDGATEASYTTSVTDLDCDGFQYYCRVSNRDGSALNSDAAVLHVSEAPTLPETGDSSTPLLWLAMSMLSVLCILLLRKKHTLKNA